MRRLESTWTFWENRVSLTNKDKPQVEYQLAVKKMCRFDTLEEFAAYWKHPDTYVNSILNFFDCQGIKKFLLGGEIVCSNTISLFRDDIMPLWQDPKNSTGGELFTIIKMEPPEWDRFYSTLVFTLIGNSSPFVSKILGVRFHFSKKASTESVLAIKLQLWTSFNSKNPEPIDSLKSDLVKLFASLNVSYEPMDSRDHSL